MASNIRVNSNPTGNIHINANDERPRYAGYTITAERSQTEHGTLITAEDWRGITESMVYDGVGIETLVYNDDFTVTITLMDGRTFTTEDTVARGVDQAESAAEHAHDSQVAATASEAAAESSAASASASATSASDSAESAEASATEAERQKGMAGAYVLTANAYRKQAENSATAASASASEAATSAGNASASASAAASSASSASASATSASGSASSASSDAERANSYMGLAMEAQSAAETAADNAESSETSASAWAVEASTYASNASASATASATSASEAEASAQAAAQSAASLVIDETLTEAGQAAEAKAVGDALAAKAEIDGYYEDMTVGDAEQLISSMYVEDSEPYGYRTTGGSADVGNREYVDAIVGGTIAWNQQAEIASSSKTTTKNGITATDNRDGSYTLSGTASEFTPIGLVNEKSWSPNHKYIFWGCPPNGSASTYQLRMCGAGEDTAEDGNGALWNPGTTTWKGISAVIQEGITLNNLVFKPQIFDLTAMFGSTIADYIYSLEQANAGAGVAWFKKLFPKDYYEYNAGELISVSGLQSHDMVGFNQFDKSTATLNKFITAEGTILNDSVCFVSDYIKVVPNATYYCNHISGTANHTNAYCLYDESKNLVGYGSSGVGYENAISITMGDNVHYIRFNGLMTQINATCINLSWSGWRNGEYEPYQKHSYPLDSSLTLRGIPKLDASNNLYYDGDEYLPSGSVTRKYGIVDLGTLNWIADGGNVYHIALVDAKNVNDANAITDAPYTHIPQSATAYDKIYKIVWGANGLYVYFRNDSTASVNDFIATVQGKQFVYELATPTTETAEPYQHIQICDDFGTEEFVSTSIVPVGHSTRYPANLRDKLQHLPNLADNDGAYLIRQTNKQMSLEVFRIPKAPTTDGTYVLKATVSGGSPTYTWESEE